MDTARVAPFHPIPTHQGTTMFTSNSSPDQSTKLVDQTADKADQAIKSTQRVANGAFDSLSASVHDLREQAVPALNRATEQASALAHRSLSSVRQASQHLRDKAARASDSTVNYVRDEPVKAMLIAAATGAVLMALMSMLSHTRHHD